MSTCLNIPFLLLVVMVLLFSNLQNHLLNFCERTQVLVNFSSILDLCSAWVLIFASVNAQLYDLNLAQIYQAGRANCSTLNTWHLSTLSRFGTIAPSATSRRIIHIRFQALPTMCFVFPFVFKSDGIWYPTSFISCTTSKLASSDR